jgi:ABC-type antimicrobial peptide transport system permease subunit
MSRRSFRASRAHRLTALVARALRTRRGRGRLVMMGVALSALLVLVLLGAYRNLAKGISEYAGAAGHDLWITPAGTDNLVRSSGVMPLEWEELARAVSGVEAAGPILRSFVSLDRPGERAGGPASLTMLALAFRSPAGLGGPRLVVTGGRDLSAGGILIDRAAAFRLSAHVGDTLLVNGSPAVVTGITRGTNLVATQLLFADFASLSTASGIGGIASFIVVRLAPGADPRAVADALREQLPRARIIPRDEFVHNNVREVASGFVPLLSLLSVVGMAVTGLLVALLVQGSVDERRDEIAVLLALGTPMLAIAAGVTIGVLLLIVPGAVLGAAATIGLARILDLAFPAVELTVQAADTLLVLSMFVTAGMIAALIPVLRLRSIDPLEAFRP